MQRHSVSSFPYILTQDNTVDDKPNLIELLSPHRDNVSCNGQTLKLHQRLPGRENTSSESTPRRISVSYKSLLVAPPEVPTRRKSTSSVPSSRPTFIKPDKTTQNPPNTPNLLLPTTTEENHGRLNEPGSKITANEKTSSCGEDLNKLPKIILTKTEQPTEKNRKKRRRKDGSKEESESLETKESVFNDTKNSKSSNTTTEGVEAEKVPDGSTRADEEEADGEDLKYRLEARYFQLGVEDTTRPFTYSYFPKIKSAKPKKKPQDKRSVKKPSGSVIKIKVGSAHTH